MLVLGLAGCGRLGFDDLYDASLEGVPVGHDEDGDGVPDMLDVCPHLPGPQIDVDGDGVGDDCDPEPTNPRQRLLQFSAMTPDDQPATLVGAGVWTQLADAIHFDGTLSGQVRQSGLTFQDVQVTIGADVQAVAGGASVQHQVSLFAAFSPPQLHYFVELNERLPSSSANVTYFDGTNYFVRASQPLANGWHTGPVELRLTQIVGVSTEMRGGWPGEMYTAIYPETLSHGGDRYQININNLVLDLRYIHIVSWQ